MTFALALLALFTGVFSILDAHRSTDPADDARFKRKLVQSAGVVGAILLLVLGGNAALHALRGPQPETVAEYRYDQHEICFSLLDYFSEIDPADDKRPPADLVERDRRVIDDASARLHALRPPSHYRAENDAFTSAIDAFKHVLDAAPAAARASNMRSIDAAASRMVEPALVKQCVVAATSSGR